MNLLPEAPDNRNNNEPLYNIGVVTRMTGITTATLRAWERRYEFPQSGRTSGGHRLYSEKDILRLRWVKERIAEGMQTAQAVQALRYQEEAGTFTTAPAASEPPSEKMALLSPAAQITSGDECHKLVKLLIEHDLDQADQYLNEALATLSPEALILHVIGPAMAAIGDYWEEGRIDIATEHLATNYLRQKLLIWMVNGPPPVAHPPIILACAPNEWHEGSLLMLGALLRRRRWPVVYLGQAVPLADLANFARQVKPSVIVLVAMLEPSASELLAWPPYLAEVLNQFKIKVGYGGRIFSLKPEWQQRIPGIYLGASIEQGLENIERMLKT